MENGAYIPHMRSVFPSLTYPCHASIVTGRYPNSHRVVNNRKKQVHREHQDWYWWEKDIQGDSCIRAAQRARKSVGAILVPVNAGAKIRANIAEIFPNRPWQNQALCSLRSSTLLPLLACERRFGKTRKGIRQPDLDEYVMQCAGYYIEHYPLDLLWVHMVDLDDAKHRYGLESKEREKALIRMDAHIGEILDWQKDEEDVQLIFFSDHGQLPIRKMKYPLNALADYGLLERDGNTVKDYAVVAHSAGGACYFYAGRKLLPREEEKWNAFQKQWSSDLDIARTFTPREAAEQGADAQCLWMLDARDGVGFSEFFRESEAAEQERQTHLANHGFHPDHENYDAVLFAHGSAFRENFRGTVRRRIIDIAPTVAKLLELPLTGAEGDVLEEIFSKGVDRIKKSK